MQIDPAPMWHMLLDDLSRGLPAANMALRFHNGLSKVLVETTQRLAARAAGGSPFDTVALSGGCFQNRILFESVAAELRAAGFVVLTHADVPANDGGLALGQAAIGAARLLETARPQERPQTKGRDHVSRHSRLHRQNRRCGEYARDRRYLRRPPADQYLLRRRRRPPGGKLASVTGCWSMSALP